MKTVNLIAVLFLTSLLSAQPIEQNPGLILEKIISNINKSIPEHPSSYNLRTNPIKRMDSIISIYVGTTVGRDTKWEYEYDVSNNPIEEKTYYRTDSTQAWEYSAYRERIYNTNDQLTELTFLWGWSATANEYHSGFKYEFVYDNNLIAEELVSIFDKPSQSWENYLKYLRSFNASGLEIQEVTYQWFNGQWELLDKFLTTYNTNNSIALYEEFQYNGFNMAWEPSSKTDYFYNTNDTLIQTIVFDYASNGWEYYLKYDFTYQSSGFLGGSVFSEWKPSGWENSAKSEYVNDQFGNTTSRITSVWDLVGNWHISQRDQYVYDSNFPYATLVTFLSEEECRHQLLSSAHESLNTVSYPTLEPEHNRTYYWSDLFSTNIHSVPILEELTVYPNPATSFLHFELPKSTLPASIVLYNSIGQQVINQSLTGGKLQLSDLPTGPYSYLVQQEKKIYSGTVIIKQ